MYKVLVVFVFCLLFSCNNNEYKKPENALDAGREFIHYSLIGRFNTAKKYMIQDEENLRLMEKVSDIYNKMTEQEKAGYNSASINIKEVQDMDDSATIINYSNSYKKRDQKVKVIKYNGEWLVDFKYTFVGQPVE